MLCLLKFFTVMKNLSLALPSSSFKKISPCLIFLNTKHLLSINCVSDLLCLSSPTLHTKKLLYFCFRLTNQGWRLARTTVQKDGDFLITGHIVFNSRVPKPAYKKSFPLCNIRIVFRKSQSVRTVFKAMQRKRDFVFA